MIKIKAALKQTNASSVNTIYLIGLHNDNTGIAGVSEWIMTDYLNTNLVNIKYEDVVANNHQLTNLFNPTQTIFNIFNRYKEISTLSTKRRQQIST